MYHATHWAQTSRSSTRWSPTRRRSCRPSPWPTLFAPTRWWRLRTSPKTRCASFTPTSQKTRPLGSTTPNLQSVSVAVGSCWERHRKRARIHVYDHAFSSGTDGRGELGKLGLHKNGAHIRLRSVRVFILNPNQVCWAHLNSTTVPLLQTPVQTSGQHDADVSWWLQRSEAAGHPRRHGCCGERCCINTLPLHLNYNWIIISTIKSRGFTPAFVAFLALLPGRQCDWWIWSLWCSGRCRSKLYFELVSLTCCAWPFRSGEKLILIFLILALLTHLILRA